MSAALRGRRFAVVGVTAAETIRAVAAIGFADDADAVASREDVAEHVFGEPVDEAVRRCACAASPTAAAGTAGMGMSWGRGSCAGR